MGQSHGTDTGWAHVCGCPQARLTSWDLVCFADADMTFLPEGQLDVTAARWARMAHAMVNASWPEFISNADSMSPVNGGVFIVKPSHRRYAEGLAVLHRCAFNATHGWDLVGPPSSLGLTYRHPDGVVLTRQGADTGDYPHLTDAYRRDDWRFVGADADQGFLFYL